jgi:hypothetical protein
MNFEEIFPSLKSFGCDSFESDDGEDNVVEMDELWYPETEIIRGCVDKVRVREGLGNIKCDMSTKQGQETYQSILKLKKELKL